MLTRSAGSPVRYNRAQWFAALLVAAVLSGYFNIVRASLRLGDAWSAGAGLLGINAITWIALFAILHLALDSKAAEAPRRLDLAILGLGAVSLFMPSGWEARAFVFVGALYLFLTSARGEIGRKIAIIALALSVPLIWARLAIYLFGPELLPFDAALVGLVTGLPVNGNVVDFPTAVGVADGRQMVILSGCSSFTNVSMSIVVMAIVSQLLDLSINRRLILVGACAAVAAMSVNIARLALIALKPEHYEFLHVGLGASLFGYASLIAIGAVAIAGTYRARRARAARGAPVRAGS